MNAIVLAILVMVTLSLARVSVVFALIVASLVGGLYAGMPLAEILDAFNDGLGGGATIALSYAVLGAFAVALSRSGITELMANRAIRRFHLDEVGTAAALGDAGSPASDSTLGPTAGLNADGQHDHIWDSVVPTFLHYNIPLIAFGWAAAMLL